MKDRELICDRCRKSVSVSEIRYVPLGGDKLMTICTECKAKGIAQKKSGKSGNNLQRTLQKAAEIESPNQKVRKADSQGPKTTYMCERCNYKFNFSQESGYNLKCAFCGRVDKLKKIKIISADSLIGMSEGFD